MILPLEPAEEPVKVLIVLHNDYRPVLQGMPLNISPLSELEKLNQTSVGE